MPWLWSVTSCFGLKAKEHWSAATINACFQLNYPREFCFWLCFLGQGLIHQKYSKQHNLFRSLHSKQVIYVGSCIKVPTKLPAKPANPASSLSTKISSERQVFMTQLAICLPRSEPLIIHINEHWQPSTHPTTGVGCKQTCWWFTVLTC